MANNKLLVIVGPTAIGKSQFAIDIAQQYSGEWLDIHQELGEREESDPFTYN